MGNYSNIVMASEREVRFKPVKGSHRRNDGIVTHYNPPAIGDKDLYKMAILPIPKNASSSMRNLIWMTTYHTKQNWSDPAHMIDLVEHWRHVDDIIIILRDPYERFLSALNMFLSTRQWEGGCIKIDDDTITILNEHFYPQSWYLEDVLTAPDHIVDKCRFFYMSNTDDVTKDICEKFPQFYREEGHSLNKGNASIKVVTDVDKKVIERIYSDDFDLIENTEFLNSDRVTFNRRK